MINKRGSTSFNDPNRFQQQLQTAKQFMPDFKDPAAVSEFYTDLILDAGTIMRSFPEDIPTGIASIVSRRTAKKLIKQPVQQLNNVSDLGFLKRVEDASGQTNLQTQAAQFINTGDDLTGMFKPNSLSYKKTFREFNEGIPTGQAKKDAVIRHLQAIDEGRPIPYFRDTKTGKIKYLDNKGVDAKTGEVSYMMRDITLKRKDSSFRRAAEKAKTIPLQDYIDELGEVLGKKGYDLDQKRFERLYRWVGKNVHVDHMNPLMGEGFHHPSNLILLKATDNLKKGKKLLPDEFFAQMEIPLTKRDLIRSSIQNPKYSNKVKRQKILETLNIVNK